jgi:hypothetical protein
MFGTKRCFASASVPDHAPAGDNSAARSFANLSRLSQGNAPIAERDTKSSDHASDYVVCRATGGRESASPIVNRAESKGEHGPFLPVCSDRPDQIRDAPRADDIRRFDPVARFLPIV